MMFRRLMMIGLPLTLGLAWVLPFQWRAFSLEMAKAFAPDRMIRASISPWQQGQRLTVQLRTSSYSTTVQGTSIFGDGGCPNGSSNGSPNTPTVTAPLAYECKEEKLSGQAVVNFPSGPLSGTLDGYGDLVLDAVIKFTGTVEITGEISRNIGGDNRRFLELTSFFCPIVRDTKQISLTPTVWSASYDCSLNKLNRLSNGTYGLSGLGVRYFGGRLVLDSRVSAEYSSATNCQALGWQNGLAGPAQSSCLVKLLVLTTPEVLAGNSGSVAVSARKANGELDTDYSGPVQVSLATGTTPKIACLSKTLTYAACAASQPVTLAFGLPSPGETLYVLTPGQPLTMNTVLKPNDPPLAGDVVVKAESGNVSATSPVMKVISPLDLKIKTIEVQQGVNQAPAGLWVGERDLLIRVFLEANREGPDKFDKYSKIQGITAKLIVRDKAGNEIMGSPFPLSKGGIRGSYSAALGSLNTPEVDYVFDPNAGTQADGSESLNYILNPGFAEQLNLEVKLDDTLRSLDRNPDNNSAPYSSPLNFGISRTVTVVYKRLRVLASPDVPIYGGESTQLPDEQGVEQEKEFIKQAWPIAARESGIFGSHLIFRGQGLATKPTVPLCARHSGRHASFYRRQRPNR